MSETKQYHAHKDAFYIAATTDYRQVVRNGEPVMETVTNPHIVFSNGSYSTSDEQEQERIESHPGFRETPGPEADVWPAVAEQEIPDTPDTGSSGLEADLRAAETAEDVNEILAAHGLPSLSQEQAEAKAEAAGDLEAIEGVTKKREALDALESTGVDVTVTMDDTIDDIVAFAEEHGYSFVDWP